MKRLWLSIRDIGAILLLTILSMVVGGVWLQSLPMHYFLAPLIEFMIFWPGFVFLKKGCIMMSFRQLNFLPLSEKITLAMRGYYSDYLTEVFGY